MSAFILYALAGASAGVVAGLFGVGGGLLMVPILVWSFQANQFSPDISIHLAIGTSLAIIVVTSLSSIAAHHRRGAVLWAMVRKLVPSLLIGALIGSVVAKQLSGAWLGRFFGGFALFVALQMVFQRVKPVLVSGDEGGFLNSLEMWGFGTLIGGLSAVLGIGGGSLTVPFLTRRRLTMQHAIATAAVCGLPIAIAGAAGFIFVGQDVSNLPAGCFGYLYLPAFLGMAIFSLLTAPVGAALAHKLQDFQLRRGFAAFLVLMGVKMLTL
ncbi:MAG: hypothetical protein RIT27_1430 [Pseudomonadota bacterium]|jgi:uncharacterized membrane protein YfcA